MKANLYRRHLLNAYWCIFNEIAGKVDLFVRMEQLKRPELEQYSKDGVIILNIGGFAANRLSFNDSTVSFDARMKGESVHFDIDYSWIIGVRHPESDMLHSITHMGVYISNFAVPVLVECWDKEDPDEPIETFGEPVLLDNKPVPSVPARKRPSLSIVK